MLISEIEVAIIYIYIYLYNPNYQHYFLSKLKFMHNPTLYSVTTPSTMR
jgi:hypothetical protein